MPLSEIITTQMTGNEGEDEGNGVQQSSPVWLDAVNMQNLSS